jgi:hypothetical protein
MNEQIAIALESDLAHVAEPDRLAAVASMTDEQVLDHYSRLVKRTRGLEAVHDALTLTKAGRPRVNIPKHAEAVARRPARQVPVCPPGGDSVTPTNLALQLELAHRGLADLLGVEPESVRITVHDLPVETYDALPGERRVYGCEHAQRTCVKAVVSGNVVGLVDVFCTHRGTCPPRPEES